MVLGWRVSLPWLLTLVAATHALAYENDVHYGLTKWLALKAGFSSQEAEQIAYGNKYVDGGALDAVRLVLFSACLGKDVSGSDTVLKHHFPSGATVPSPPAARTVTGNSGPAKIMSERVIQHPTGYPERDLRDLGTGLHALQDSFSHEGVPDVPGFWLFSCSSEYSWGHPVASGGWSVHDADLTYLPANRGKAVAMAQTTYEQLCKFREVVRRSKCDSRWQELQATVASFVQASTKSEKWTWFRADKMLQNEFKCDLLEGINIPDGGAWCEQIQYRTSDSQATLRLNSNESEFASAKREKSPRNTVEATLYTWFVKRDVVALTRWLVDHATFSAVNGLANYSADKVATAATALFTLWLYQDHGLVHRSLGLKGDELMRLGIIQSALSAGFTDRFVPPKDARIVKYNSLSEALYEVGPSKELFDFKVAPCKDGKGECALAAARLKKAPYETLLLEYRKAANEWLLVKVWSLVDR